MDLAPGARDSWLAERRSGIGGTDAAAILGFSDWGTPLEVWLDKRGELPEKPATEAMWWGSAMEALVARRYAEVTGRALVEPEAGRVFRHHQHPMLIGTPDRLVYGERRGLECKTAHHRAAHEWGPDGTDVVPPAYVVQCCHYMAVTGYPLWDVAVLIGGSDFRHYTLRRDVAMERMLVDRLVEWWQRHVVGGEQPEVTGRESVRAALGRRWPADNGGLLMLRDLPAKLAAEAVLAGNVATRARKMARNAGEHFDAAANTLRAILGENERLEGCGWTARWRGGAESFRVDWQGMANEMLDWFAMTGRTKLGDQFYDAHTASGPGVRRFEFIPRDQEGQPHD